MSASTKSLNASETDFDVVVVGAGFSGLFMLHRLRELGLRVLVIEEAQGVGGTWYWNAYPGARCDVESVEYSYQFSDELQQEWDWTERYASQPEILRYIDYVAEKFDLLKDIKLSTRVSSAKYDEASNHWAIETSTGVRLVSRFFVLATGVLSAPYTPDFPGMDAFSGDIMHTGKWPQTEYDFAGKRVGVIGTGSSGVQCSPLIAEQAKELKVFQRTPTYSVPAGNTPLSSERLAEIKADYAGLRERNTKTMGGYGAAHPINQQSALEVSELERRKQYEHRWSVVGGLLFLGAYNDLLTDPAANETAAEFVREKIREKVDDPAVAELLTPSTMIGCKRLCSDSGYYEMFNRSNVDLVDVAAAPIAEITATGIKTEAGHHELDCIVFATGFDAITGAITKIDVVGKDGLSLNDKWADGPLNYLGVGTTGFPNLFTVVGPGNPSVLTNIVCTLEHHVSWIVDCIEYLRSHDIAAIEVLPEFELDWVSHINEMAETTIFTQCNSWYLGANVPGKPRVFMPYIGLPEYRDKCSEVAAQGYPGFSLQR